MGRRKRHRQFGSIQQRLFWMTALLLVWVLCSGAAHVALAGMLSDRIDQFPHWQDKPVVTRLKANAGDLEYPDWMAGNWTVESTLIELYAPLAPDIVTPGFEGNRKYVGQPLTFEVRFGPANPPIQSPRAPFPFSGSGLVKSELAFRDENGSEKTPVVADRAFNGLNLAQAYLGEDGVARVTTDPANPNRQITDLQGRTQLVSTVTGRATEAPAPDEFIATEVVQQIFRGVPQPYLNEVESTTIYRRSAAVEGKKSPPEADSPTILADQFTAIYLSPQDPDYFRVRDQPVALYRYRLEFRS